MKKQSRITLRGDGMFDVVKSIGKAVAPALIDLASQEAKKRVGGGIMEDLMTVLSGGQIRKLRQGGAITLKADMFQPDAQHSLRLQPATMKKLMSAMKKGKGMRYSRKAGEDVIDRMTGKGIFDIVKSIGKTVAPVLIDLAASEAKKRAGGGIFDVVKSIGKAAAPALIDLASQEAKKRVSGGRMGIRSRKQSVMSANGNPQVSVGGGMFSSILGAVAPTLIDLAANEAKKRAGGGIYPAGSYGRGIDGPIQLGSPYQSMQSPAMSPFMPHSSQLSGYNPIKKGNGFLTEGIAQFLPI